MTLTRNDVIHRLEEERTALVARMRTWPDEHAPWSERELHDERIAYLEVLNEFLAFLRADDE